MKILKNQKGMVALLPVLIVAAVLVLAATTSAINKKNSQNQGTSVLSESSDSGSDSSSNESDSSGGSTIETVKAEDGGSSAPESTDKPEVHNQNENENLNQNEGETQNQEMEQEREQEQEFEVKEGTESSKVMISSQAGAFRFRETEFGSQSQFPLSVDKNTSELKVTTPAGVKIVAILPDQAVKNMLASGQISQILQNTQTGQNQIQLVLDSNGNLLYEIGGVKYKKLLGIFTIKIDKTGQVSAENGGVVGINQSVFSKLLDILSV